MPKCMKCGGEAGNGSFCKDCGVPPGSANVAPMSQSAVAKQKSKKVFTIFVNIAAVLFFVLYIAARGICVPADLENMAKKAAVQLMEEYYFAIFKQQGFEEKLIGEVEVIDKDEFGRYMVTMTWEEHAPKGIVFFDGKAIHRTKFAVIVRLIPGNEKRFYHYGRLSYSAIEIEAHSPRQRRIWALYAIRELKEKNNWNIP